VKAHTIVLESIGIQISKLYRKRKQLCYVSQILFIDMSAYVYYSISVVEGDFLRIN